MLLISQKVMIIILMLCYLNVLKFPFSAYILSVDMDAQSYGVHSINYSYLTEASVGLV